MTYICNIFGLSFIDYMLNREDVFKIWLHLAKTFPNSERVKIETFYEVGSIPGDYLSPSLNKTNQDKLDGLFWTRDNQQSDSLKYEYPVLGLEQKFKKISSECSSSKGSMTFNVSLVDQVDRSCDCERSESLVYSDLLCSIEALWNEFKTFTKVVTTNDDSLWMSYANMNYIKNHPEKFPFEVKESNCKIETCLMVENNSIDIYPIDKGFLNNGIGVGLSFTIRNCSNKTKDFTYCPPSKSEIQIGFPVCSEC